MHKSKQDISELFHDKLNIPLTDDAEELTMSAREHLRQSYTTADIGITGGNFLLAEEGAICITENEGNARLSLSCPPIHIAIVGIEKVLPSSAELSLFWPLLATSGTGQQITSYNSIIKGPKKQNEHDGPNRMIVILLDNGRSRIYNNDHVRESLKCIRCGACLNTCPIFKNVGGHSYHTTYQGPIGSVITPHLDGFEDWQHLPQASSLCGSCTSVCPVHIPLHEMLLENRWISDQKGTAPATWRWMIKGWRMIMQKRSRLNTARRFMKPMLKLVPGINKDQIPDIPAQTFADRWRQHVNKT